MDFRFMVSAAGHGGRGLLGRPQYETVSNLCRWFWGCVYATAVLSAAGATPSVAAGRPGVKATSTVDRRPVWPWRHYEVFDRVTVRQRHTGGRFRCERVHTCFGGIGELRQEIALSPIGPAMPFPDDPVILQQWATGPVRVGRKWGIIDTAGKFIVLPRFDRIMGFTDGLAIASNEKGGYVFDRNGHILRNLACRTIICRVRNVVFVETKEGAKHLIDLHGNALASTADLVLECATMLGDDLLEIEIDEAGPTPRNQPAELFPEQRTRRLHGVVDESGRLVVPPRYEQVKLLFGEQRIGVLKDGKCGLFDRSGRALVEPSYKVIWPLDDRLARVAAGNRWGIIDRDGNLVLPLAYEAIGGCAVHGLIPVAKDSKAGFCDDSGRLVIRPKFDFIESYRGGLSKNIRPGSHRG